MLLLQSVTAIPLGLSSMLPVIIKLDSACVNQMLKEDVVSGALQVTMVSTVDWDAHCVTATCMDQSTASVTQRLDSAPVGQV